MDVIDFNVILGMDWLARNYATLDCQEKEVIFRILNVMEFQFRGDKISIPQNLIFEITTRKMLRRGCHGYLAMVRDIKAGKEIVENVPVVCEFPDAFPQELSRLPQEREIEFFIDVVPGIDSISMPPYRMAPVELKELNE